MHYNIIVWITFEISVETIVREKKRDVLKIFKIWRRATKEYGMYISWQTNARKRYK